MAGKKKECWCDHRDAEISFRTKRFGLVRCKKCGCYRIDPPPLSQEEEGQEFYTDYYSKNGNLGPQIPEARSSRFWRVAERFPELNEPARDVLDFGCGEGTLCSELQDAGWNSVTGIDVSRSRISRARQLTQNIHFHDRCIREIGISPSSLDLVVMDNVIEHLPNPLSVVIEIGAYLCDGGRVAIITPNMESGNFRLLGRFWTPELAPHTHIFLFTASSLQRLVMMAGLSVLASGSFQLPAYTFAAWKRKLRSRNAKEILWTLGQEAGSVFSKLIGSGPMLFVVAEKR